MTTLKDQLEQRYGPKVKRVRYLRKILRATDDHNYEAELYEEFSDGTRRFMRITLVNQSDTQVRLRQCKTAVWEEKVAACPGWFRCNSPSDDIA